MADYENGKMETSEGKSPEEHTYTSSDLQEMGEVLLKAKEIQSDKGMHDKVMGYLNSKVKKIKTLNDLRLRLREVETKDNEMIEAYEAKKPKVKVEIEVEEDDED